MDAQFLTAEELAKRWHIKRKTVYQLKGKVPYHKFKGSIRFKLEDVIAYERNNRITTEEKNSNGGTS